jgi:hypothetical protein
VCYDIWQGDMANEGGGYASSGVSRENVYQTDGRIGRVTFRSGKTSEEIWNRLGSARV